jgi:Spy/CpxP family protein refolding chaperone
MAQHHLQFLTTVLSLTSAQQQQAQTLMTSASTSEQDLHAQDKAAHEALDAAVVANNPSAISQAAAVIGNVAAQRAEIHGKTMAAFYQLLTPDQQAKFTQLHAQGPGMGGMGHHPMN